STLSNFATTYEMTAASVTAIGAFEKATVGWFDFASRSYRKIPVAEQCEVLSLLGDIATGDDGKASLHLHAVLGLKDGSTRRGGHFIEGIVHPTLEVTIIETPAYMHRRHHKDLGIALIEL
ncbi:DNA-binding protein, partial [Rhizobium sp. BR 318]|uniref:PPC domain-containing DNA-binding protein n=1 Tax=Rhizobium sp. BR 318 TaxID=3040669 RepID=UPI002F41A625